MDPGSPDAVRRRPGRPNEIHWVASPNSGEFALFSAALSSSSVVGLDAEWKPATRPVADAGDGDVAEKSFPPVTLLQIACWVSPSQDDQESPSQVFLLDLISIPLSTIYGMLKSMFLDRNVLKLGFRFKQDLAYLSSTFCSHGCEPGFDKVEPFLDIATIYLHLQGKLPGKKMPKHSKSLAAICKELLNVHLSKELQCSDWSCRPLSEEQKLYAAADAFYLLEIFSIFHVKVLRENSLHETSEAHISSDTLGLKEIVRKTYACYDHSVVRLKFCEAVDMIKDTLHMSQHQDYLRGTSSNVLSLDESLSKLVQKYGERIVLKESDRKPKASKRNRRKQSSLNSKYNESLEDSSVWLDPPPWDASHGGDGCPKFLCDVMVEGLAKHLRCVGIDAAVPSTKKPEPRELIDQAHKEQRVLLTRDTKLVKYRYLINNQVYRVKSLLKNDQLIEVIETFQLKISEDRLMSRCTKCNGKFIQKPLTTEEAIIAAKGFQIIPNCLFNRNIEFWQCTDCSQLYWEGTQYHNAVQKFIDVCKLND